MSKILYINGQDIKFLALGIGENDKQIDLQIYDVDPDYFLKSIIDFLDKHKLIIQDIEKMFVIVGPGSATSLRSVLSIINTIILVDSMEVVSVYKDGDEQDNYTFNLCLSGGVKIVEHKKYLFPIYKHEPRITISTKDKLGRQK